MSDPARSPLDRRRAGILLHPTSLPGGVGNGDMGPDAYRFLDWMVDHGFSVWQTLPLGPPHADLSPYRCQSVHAGNERLISLDLLVSAGWLQPDGGPAPDEPGWAYRRRRLGEAREGFERHAGEEDRRAFQGFIAERCDWLDHYALFQALREVYHGEPWWRWEPALRDREPGPLSKACHRLQARMNHIRFEQFLFFRQWLALKGYAAQRRVLIFGDMPLFVAEDSADVWAQRHYFRVNELGRPLVVTGVPPDYFSSTGQLWGNPHYVWSRMREDGFRWWVERLRTHLEQFDLIRLDHFRGLESCWEIPAGEETAINGHWAPAPGRELLHRLHETFDHLPLVAEDLGIITPEVEALRDEFGLPGMKILQFAFDGGAGNPYLPHNHVPNAVVYTGTHDNDTSVGWFRGLDDVTRHHVQDYLGCDAQDMPMALCRAALASVARFAVIPMQDILGLGTRHRMNSPGSKRKCNWRWRLRWAALEPARGEAFRSLNELFGRC